MSKNKRLSDASRLEIQKSIKKMDGEGKLTFKGLCEVLIKNNVPYNKDMFNKVWSNAGEKKAKNNLKEMDARINY